MPRSQLYPLIADAIGTACPTLPDLRAWQQARLNETIAHAQRHSRFYAGHLAGLSGPFTLESLKALPFTTERHLADGLEAFLCVPEREVARIVTLPTSGSTGPPKRIGFSEADLAATVRFFAAGMREMAGPGQTVMVCLPGTAEDGLLHLLSKALVQMDVTPLPYGMISRFDDAARFMQAHRPHCIVGLPVQVMGLAAHVAAHCPTAAAHLSAALMAADHVAPSVQARIERDFGCTVFNHYGATEMGYGASVDCHCHAGLHLRENDLYFEVVHPTTGDVLGPGEEGELVFTTLTRQAMPLIRYRTGDAARMLAEPCGCTSPFPRIAAPRRVPHCTLAFGPFSLKLLELDDCVFAYDAVLDYQLTQRADGAIQLDIWAPPLPEARAQALLAQLYDAPLTARMRQHVPLHLAFAPSHLPRPCTQGKRIFR